MTFEYKDKEYSFPSLLSEITLGRRIAFYEQHGKAMDAQAAELEKAREEKTMSESDMELAVMVWRIEMAVRSFSFYSGIPLEEVQGGIDINDVMTVYNVDIELLMEQEREVVLQPSYRWKDENWTIAPPDLKTDSGITFNEFLHAKEIVRQLQAVGRGKWDALPYLCAIYLRKENEPFSEALVSENSERMQLMQELPLDIALAVGFFLSCTLSIYLNISASSTKGSLKESIQPATSTGGDGNLSLPT